MPLTEESQARITPTLQTVTRSLSLIGLGNSPLLTRRHKVEELTEMTGRRSFSLTKPSSGLSEKGACHVGFLVAWVVVSVFTLFSFFWALRPGQSGHNKKTRCRITPALLVTLSQDSLWAVLKLDA